MVRETGQEKQIFDFESDDVEKCVNEPVSTDK